MKNAIFVALSVLLVTINSFADFDWVSLGFKDGVTEMPGIPKVLQNYPLIAVAAIPEGKEIIYNASGERIGKIGEDYFDIGGDLYPISRVVGGEMNGVYYFCFINSNVIILMADVPADAKGLARYMIQNIYMNGNSIKYFVK